MDSRNLNQLIADENMFREILGPKIGISLPTLRKKLDQPGTFTIDEMNALGKAIKQPKILSKFVPKA